jgi:hypothetical protein
MCLIFELAVLSDGSHSLVLLAAAWGDSNSGCDAAVDNAQRSVRVPDGAADVGCEISCIRSCGRQLRDFHIRSIIMIMFGNFKWSHLEPFDPNAVCQLPVVGYLPLLR